MGSKKTTQKPADKPYGWGKAYLCPECIKRYKIAFDTRVDDVPRGAERCGQCAKWATLYKCLYRPVVQNRPSRRHSGGGERAKAMREAYAERED